MTGAMDRKSLAYRSSGGTGGQRQASEALTLTPMDNQTDSSAPPVPLARLVERWLETAIRVQNTFGKIENAFMASPENEIRSAIWAMFGEYTRTLAAQLSDDAEDARGWLEWFAWECDFGRKPMEMVFANGETLLVVGASDLLAAIRTDEHGNRVWDSPLNVELVHPLPASAEGYYRDRVHTIKNVANTAAGSGLHEATCSARVFYSSGVDWSNGTIQSNVSSSDLEPTSRNFVVIFTLFGFCS
jgi:hypothetical protein